MKNIFITLFLLTLSLTSAQGALIRRNLPDNITAVIQQNYQYGRREMDFGGVSKVVVFEISGDERAEIPALLLKEIALQTKDDSVGSFIEHCKIEEEITDLDKCIRHVLATGERINALPQLRRWERKTGYKEEDENFSKPIRTIREYVEQLAGPNYLEYNTNSNIWSVDVMTSALINEDRTTAVVIFYDWGA